MTLVQDGIGAMITYLKAQSAISSLLSTRVYGLELPESEVANMPRKNIVINSAGGIGQESLLDVYTYRLDFLCYGETPFEAYETWRTLRTELRDMTKNVSAATFLYSAVHSAGPFSFRDQETDWPVTLDTWLVMTQDTIVT